MSENDPKLSAREATADVRASSFEQSSRGGDDVARVVTYRADSAWARAEGEVNIPSVR